MSTAGKVLVVLVMLTTVVWIILAAGVAQLNTNGNKALHDLSEQVAKLQVDLKQNQDDIASFRDETSSIQEKVDRDRTVLEARLARIEKDRSEIVDTLERTRYELTSVQDTIKSAQTAINSRTAERQAEEKALAAARAEVQSLMADTTQLASRLKGLRDTFKSTYMNDVELIGKRH
jgi:chromosome segregation ATPase